MAIGIVTNLEFDSELSKLNSQNQVESSNVKSSKVEEIGSHISVPSDEVNLEKVEYEKLHKGRGDSLNVPESLRKLIAGESIESGRKAGIELGKEFGVNQRSVDAYAAGATSPTTPNVSLRSHVDQTKLRVAARARNKLNLALNRINVESLNGVRAKDAAGIAKDMSVIIKNMEPASPITELDSRPQFVIFAPQFRDERSYDTIVQTDEE